MKRVRLSHRSGISRWGRHSCLPLFQPAAKKRSGTTLTEVLMSLLIMGIGLVTVATIFPISVLRSIQATQLTRATALRYNVDAAIELHNLTNGPYQNGVIVKAQSFGQKKVTIIDPLGFYDIDPTDNLGFDFQHYIGGDQTNFGQNAPGIPRAALDHSNPLLNILSTAEALVTLPDSWLSIADDVEFTISDQNAPVGLDRVIFGTIDLSDFNGTPTAGSMRVMLFDDNGKQSVIRNVTTVAGSTIDFADFDPPIGFTVGRVRVEIQERRYTWLLTARHRFGFPPPPVNIDVVVFFNRSLSAADEQIFNVTPDANDRRTYTVDTTSGSLVNKGVTDVDSEPFLKRGGFMFDLVNGRWYRIQQVDGNKIVLESAPPAGEAPTQRAIFMRGIVEVYPIKSKL